VFDLVQPLCVSVLDGYNVCIFAYGQTGREILLFTLCCRVFRSVYPSFALFLRLQRVHFRVRADRSAHIRLFSALFCPILPFFPVLPCVFALVCTAYSDFIAVTCAPLRTGRQVRATLIFALFSPCFCPVFALFCFKIDLFSSVRSVSPVFTLFLPSMPRSRCLFDDDAGSHSLTPTPLPVQCPLRCRVGQDLHDGRIRNGEGRVAAGHRRYRHCVVCVLCVYGVHSMRSDCVCIAVYCSALSVLCRRYGMEKGVSVCVLCVNVIIAAMATPH
jgi:hypothetical protein